ncbi:MAG: hypothetical protein HOE19_03700 [Candidatus Komeilibacteria bacterium]|jgi:hypothetical protein|nr:hypothetical protein [Candidatus Komeilibacteria bacterium]MBT4447781.1 hypothetical protein [Candidatus Komeilibacteria bacterium]
MLRFNWLEDRLLAFLLKRLKPIMTRTVFREVLGKFVLVAIEAVILRKSESGIEVFLTRRSVDDLDWPNMWHIPGSYLRQSDTGHEDALKRIQDEELAWQFLSTQFVGFRFLINATGKSQHMGYLCTLEGVPPTGRFFPVDQLPTDFISEQQEFLNIALERFQA